MGNENEHGVIGKILSQGHNVEEVSETDENISNEGEMSSGEEISRDLGEEIDLEKSANDEIYLGDLMEGVQLTGLTGVTMEDVGRNPEKFQDLSGVPETAEAKALKAERNQKFLDSMQKSTDDDNE